MGVFESPKSVVDDPDHPHAHLGRLPRGCRSRKRLVAVYLRAVLIMSHRERIGVGTDLLDVGRFRALTGETASNFFARVFTAGEIAYCESQPDPAQSFAGCFAAKEALIKALNSFGDDEMASSLDYLTIEVTHSAQGQPRITSLPRAHEVTATVSISHTESLAIAVVIVQSA